LSATLSVTHEQIQAMWQACRGVWTEPDARQASRRLAERLSNILQAPALVFRRDVSPWKLMGPSTAATTQLAAAHLAELDRALPFFEGKEKRIANLGGSSWTAVPLDEDLPAQSVLLLPGEWESGPHADWLPRFAATASLAIRSANTLPGPTLGSWSVSPTSRT